MPADSFHDENPAILEWQLSLVRDARIQMLRVWGAGGNEFCAETTDSAPLIVIAANLIRNLDGSREFMESSPVNGDWHIYPSFTDAARLWDTVLADGPFISECGARCMPSPETWEKLLSGRASAPSPAIRYMRRKKWRVSIPKFPISVWSIRKKCSAEEKNSIASERFLLQNSPKP